MAKRKTNVEKEVDRVWNALGPVIKRLDGTVDRKTLVYATISCMAAIIVDDVAPKSDVDPIKVDGLIWKFVDGVLALATKAKESD